MSMDSLLLRLRTAVTTIIIAIVIYLWTVYGWAPALLAFLLGFCASLEQHLRLQTPLAQDRKSVV